MSDRSAVKLKKPLKDYASFCADVLHYKPTAQQLQMADWFFQAMEQKNQISLLLAMRKVGKSDLLTCCATCYKILSNPHFRVVIATKSWQTQKTLMDFMRFVINEYALPIAVNNNRIILVRDERKDPAVLFTLVGSRFRGAHPDLIICDDIQDNGDERPAERRKTQHKFDELKGLCSTIILIGQLAHEQCLHSRLRFNPDVNCFELWYHNLDEETRSAIGIASLEVLRQGTTDRYIGHNYLGTHVKDYQKLYFSKLKVLPVHGWPQNENIKAYIDPAFDGDDAIGLAIGYVCHEWGETQIIAHVRHFNANISDQVDMLLTYLSEFHVETLFIEKTGNNGMVRGLFDMKRNNRQMILTTRDVLNNSNKQSRILNTLQPLSSMLRLDSNGDNDFVLYWHKEAAHDDVIDALAGLLQQLKQEIF